MPDVTQQRVEELLRKLYEILQARAILRHRPAGLQTHFLRFAQAIALRFSSRDEPSYLAHSRFQKRHRLDSVIGSALPSSFAAWPDTMMNWRVVDTYRRIGPTAGLHG